MAGRITSRLFTKAFFLLAGVSLAAPLTAHDSLLRTAASGQAASPVRAEAPAGVAIAFKPGGALQVLAKNRVAKKQGRPLPEAVKVKSAADVVVTKIGAQAEVLTADQPSNKEQTKEQTSLALAVKGGLAGMAAGVLQVLCLMWIRTAMNHQYFYGGGFTETVKSMWAEGGVLRFYQGVGFALLQVPLARFGDTFSQSVVVTFFGAPGQNMHGFRTGLMVASIGACWRLCVSPLDTLKLTSQVHGSSAGKIFARRLREGGVLELWSGAMAMFLVIWVGSVPWWAVYNMVLEYWPVPDTASMSMLRNGSAGVLASMASDFCSNWLRILKVKRQAAEKGAIGTEGYLADARDVIAKDGPAGLFLRGLGTKLVAGAIQGAFFSVLWNVLLGMMLPVAAVIKAQS